ncbi:MAG: acyl--CoA ligase [Opitutaceae bacterium]|nr:acyl--CoA ligase [Opitutaceae bacterium]
MPPTLTDAWHATVARDPAATAVIDGATAHVWSRRDMATAAEAWAEKHGGAARWSGRRVLMAEPNGPRWFEVFLGLLQAGAVVVPADATEPASALHAIAAELKAAAIWHDGSLAPTTFSGQRRTRRTDLCLVKLTSGSTGRPRARCFTHAQMLADGAQVCGSMGIQPADITLAIIPLGHSYGLGNLVMPLLAQGTSVLCSASPLPQVVAAECARWRPTVFPAVPTLLRALVRAEVDPAALASLRLVISAGAALEPDLATAFTSRFGRRVHSFYGSSETGGITFDRTGEAALTGRSVGTPLDGVALSFRAGARFTVASAAVMAPGCFSPPDRAMLTAEGELVLLGRVGRTLKVAGRRLDPVEVERALCALAGVRGASVLAHPDRPDALAAVVATELNPTHLRAALSPTMAAWKIPKRIVVVAELPTTSRGKLDSAAIRRLVCGR